MAARVFSFVARAEAAGLAPGAKAPVKLTSRADNDQARLVSCALAQLYGYWRREGRAFGDEPTVAKAAE
jgi:phosphate butyryltransferase